MDRSQAGPVAVPAERRARGGAASALLLLLALGLPVSAAGAGWRVGTGEVRISVPLKPGGAFEAKSTALSGELRANGSSPVVLAGAITLDLTTIDTGIELRNRHLREKYLEVQKGDGFDKAVLTDVRVAGAESESFRGKSAFSATLRLHGTTHAIGGECQVRDAASGVVVEASFPLTLLDFGIEPPQYLGVGVGNKLLVKVALSAQGVGQ